MVPIHAPDVRSMSGLGHVGNAAATSAHFISPGCNKPGEIGNTAALAWLS